MACASFSQAIRLSVVVAIARILLVDENDKRADCAE
jgi:hypothetical protein